MSRLILLVLGLYAGLRTMARALGPEGAVAAGHALALVCAALIAATFAWLWRLRATPVAAGMALGWAGVAGLLLAAGGDHRAWAAIAAGDPTSLAGAGALLLGGAVLHLRSVASTHRRPRVAFLGALGGLAAASTALAALAPG